MSDATIKKVSRPLANCLLIKDEFAKTQEKVIWLKIQCTMHPTTTLNTFIIRNGRKSYSRGIVIS